VSRNYYRRGFVLKILRFFFEIRNLQVTDNYLSKIIFKN